LWFEAKSYGAGAGREAARDWGKRSVESRIHHPRAAAPQWPGQQVEGDAQIPGWTKLAPRFLVAWMPEPVSPVLPGFPDRKGFTCFVLELPPEGSP